MTDDATTAEAVEPDVDQEPGARGPDEHEVC